MHVYVRARRTRCAPVVLYTGLFNGFKTMIAKEGAMSVCVAQLHCMHAPFLSVSVYSYMRTHTHTFAPSLTIVSLAS